MSSTSNVQDLLVNVFRPTYRYASNVGFVPSLVLSNISEVITDRLQTGAFVVSDTNRNTFIGSNAGANASSNGCVENVALGYSAMAGAVSSSNNTAFGYSNFYGLTNANSNVGIGPTVAMGRGNTNILIGPNVRMGDGSGNILIGSDISVGNVSKRLQLGTLLYGDLSSGFFGVNTSDPKVAFDISGTTVFRGKVGFQVEEPKYSLDVAGSIYSTERFFGGLGTVQEPVYSFEDASSSGMYVPSGYGVGAFAIATNGEPTAVFASNQVSFFQDLDVSGTFSACNVVLSAFSVQNGTATAPTITFANDQTSGFFLVSSNNVGFTTNGTRKMVLLSNGDLSMGRALVSDISASGGIFSSSGSNNIGGVTLCNGNVILTGVATNTNLLVPGWIRNTDPATALDISGGNISNSLTTRSSNFRASAGTAGVPAYSFVSDASTGLHLVNGGSALGFDTSGVLRMCLSGGFLGIGTATPRVALDVSGDISANVYNGPGGTEGAPHYTFSDDRTTGLFFPGANIVGLTAGGTERMRISNSNIGIGTKAPTNALDVSGTLRVIGVAGDITFTNGAISIAGVPVISATGVLSNATSTSNSIGGVTLSNFDLSMASTGRILAPVIRDAVTPSTYDISGGNLWYTGAIRNATVSASNQIGGVTLSNQDISLSATGRILGVATASNQIGGVTLSNFDLSLSTTGRILGVPTASNRIGGVTLSNFDLSMASTGRILAPILRDAVTPSLYDISGGNVSNSGTVTTTNAIVSGYIRNALTPITYDISGGNISNAGTTRSSNFIGTVNSASNLLGGVTLSNFDVSLSSAGMLRAATIRNALTPTQFDISGGNISNSGTIRTGRLDIRGGNAQIFLSNSVVPTGEVSLAFGKTTGYTYVGTNVAAQGEETFTIYNGTVALNVYSNAVVVPTTLRNALTPTTYDISGGNISNSGTTRSLNLQVSGLATTPGTPSFTFAIDPSSGMHRSSAGGSSVAFSTAGVQRMVISNENVGIGTTVPSATLDISGGVVRVQRNFTGVANAFVIADSAGTLATRWGLGILNAATGSGSGGNDFIINAYNDAGAFTQPVTIRRSNGHVGIGTTAPGTILDISAASVSTKTVAQVRCSDTGQAVLRLIGSNVADARGLELYHGGATTGLYAPPGQSNINFWTDGAQRMTLCNAGLGINCNAPAYQLDVASSSAATASINVSTWGRQSLGTFFWVRGHCNANVQTYRVRWNTTSRNMPDGNILDWQDNATHGSYFRILKSGIWSINYMVVTGTGGYSWVDASSSFSNGHSSLTATGAGDLIAGGTALTGTGTYAVKFTGFLPSNASRFYRFFSTNETNSAVSNTAPYLTIALLWETPDTGLTFFSP